MSAAAGVRPRVVVIWLLLLALVSAILFVQYKDRTAVVEVEDTRVTDRLLLSMPMDDIGALEIFYTGKLHRFERDTAGAWFFHAHGAAKTDDPAHAHQTNAAQRAAIETALTGFSRTRREREFARGNEADYGLTAPEMLVLVYGKNTAQLLAKFTVGSLAPDGVSRYIDSNNYPKMISIANYQIDNLLTLLKTVGATPAAK